MKFSHLASFRKVAHTGSFTRAAQELFITQPTVTQHIQMLEQELDTKLFFRSKYDTRITPEGEMLLKSVDSIFGILSDVKTSFRKYAEQVGGDLAVGATTVMGTYCLPRIIAQFIDRFPKVNFSLFYGNSHTIADWVRNGVVDLGFAPYSPGFGKLEFCFVHREPCVFAVGKNNALVRRNEVTPTDLESMPFVVREKGTMIREVVTRWLRRQAWVNRPPHLVTFTDMDAIKKLVECDTSVTALPRIALERELGLGLLKEICFDRTDLAVDYYLICRQNAEFSEASRNFLFILQQMNGMELENARIQSLLNG